jgi:hypothetical protein
MISPWGQGYVGSIDNLPPNLREQAVRLMTSLRTQAELKRGEPRKRWVARSYEFDTPWLRELWQPIHWLIVNGLVEEHQSLTCLYRLTTLGWKVQEEINGHSPAH